MTVVKDERILELVSRLELGLRGWVLVDHWEADLRAVGIASGDEPRRLVYVAVCGEAPKCYDFQCEVPNGPQPTDYRTVASGEGVKFEELLAVLESHLVLSRE